MYSLRVRLLLLDFITVFILKSYYCITRLVFGQFSYFCESHYIFRPSIDLSNFLLFALFRPFIPSKTEQKKSIRQSTSLRRTCRVSTFAAVTQPWSSDPDSSQTSSFQGRRQKNEFAAREGGQWTTVFTLWAGGEFFSGGKHCSQFSCCTQSSPAPRLLTWTDIKLYLRMSEKVTACSLSPLTLSSPSTH